MQGQKPRPAPSLDSTLSTSSTRLADAGSPMPRTQKPHGREPPPSASRIPIHNVKDQRPGIGGQRTEPAPRSRPDSVAKDRDQRTLPSSDLCPPSSAPLVEPTGVEPATPCLQSRRSPS